ncbi:hypothetical protein RIF29_07015 [Crotalaria pallida]|uniref:Uncharacterized protein n=1 Tax=Crotalaria pallida TaxID=3830 RepID=A0AAN9PAL9_CROPI
MKPQANLITNIGVDKDKLYGPQKSFQNRSEPQILCQYKFYPTYLTAKVIQVKLEDLKCCEVASRFIAEKSTELQQRGSVG